MAIAKKLGKRGFTLIELMIVVVIIGILAALAIYGVNKYVASSKSAEARSFLGRIAKDSLTRFEGEVTGPGVVPLTATAAISRSLCGPAPATIPAGAGTSAAPVAPAVIQAQKYQSTPSDWAESVEANNATGFDCLKSSLVDPQYYAYGYEAVGTLAPAAVGDTYTAFAVGDLDGDTVPSLFTLPGLVQQDAVNNDMTLTTAPAVVETNPEE